MSITNSTEQKTPTTAEQKRENFAHNSKNENGISFVVPRVFPNWNYRKIKQVFIKCGWGFVERVDVVPVGRIPKGRFKTAFVHFRPGSYNMRDREAREVLEKLSKGPSNHVQLTYDDPWYWKVFISSAQRTAEPPKPPPRPALKIPDTASEEEFPIMETTYDLSAQNDDELRAGKTEHLRDRFEDRNEEKKFDYTNVM